MLVLSAFQIADNKQDCQTSSDSRPSGGHRTVRLPEQGTLVLSAFQITDNKQYCQLSSTLYFLQSTLGKLRCWKADSTACYLQFGKLTVPMSPVLEV